MSTKADKRRQKKEKSREKRIHHNTNIRRYNTAKPRYRLDVFLEESWRMGIMTFKDMQSVGRHKEDTERRRELGEEIVPGRIVSIETGTVVVTVEGSPAKAMKGALPDNLAGSESAKKAELPELPEKTPEKVPEKTAKKGLLGFFRKS